MAAGSGSNDLRFDWFGDLFGVKTPGTLLLFFATSVLSFSLIFQSDPEATAVLSAHGWGYGPHFWQWHLWGLWLNHLLHTSLWHYLCNIYWFLIFSPVLEEILGSRRYLLQTALAAWTIGLCGNLLGEEGGIGLSGLVYFQFGYLVMVAGSDRRALKVCDRTTLVLLWGGLFLLGPLLSYSGAVRVGNVVHFAGCLFGLLAGWWSRRPETLRHTGTIFLGSASLLLAATVVLAHPFWRSDWHFWRAYRSSDPVVQLEHYSRALALDPDNPRILYNMALVQFNSEHFEQAEGLWLRCLACDPENQQVSQALFTLYARCGDAAGMQRWADRMTALDRQP